MNSAEQLSEHPHGGSQSSVLYDEDTVRRSEELGIPLEFMPRYQDIVTEDDTPVDNLFSEKQMRLLTETLYAHGNQSIRATRDGFLRLQTWACSTATTNRL